MLAIFHKSLAHPPQELNCPAAVNASTSPRRPPRSPDDIMRDFHARHPEDGCFSATFSGGAALACVSAERQLITRRRLFCSFDDVYCLFLGGLDNLSSLIKQYGLSPRTNEALLVIEAYRTLRDRGPYPADQVIKDLDGSYSFVLYDNKAKTVFTAMSADGTIPLYWGIAADGSLVVANEVEAVKGGCGKSFAPFPTGCMFHSEGGLKSFEHPMNRMKAMPRVDSEGVMCGANFKVDYYSRINSMPRVGSNTDWTSAWGEESTAPTTQ